MILTMELRLYLRMLHRGWWIIALIALAAFNAALLIDYLATPMYQTNARFVVSPNPENVSGGDVVSSLAALDKRSIVSTYAEFLNSERIYQETVKFLNLDPEALTDYSHNAVVLPDANILELTVIGPDPVLAALLANSIGQRAIGEIQQLYRVYDIRFLDPATPAEKPFSPKPARDAVLALVLGALVGGALAIVREQVRVPLDAYRRRRIIDVFSTAFTRNHFEHCLETQINRDTEEGFSLGLIRLTGLEELIDTLPRPIVQRVLRHVAEVLRRELRGNDVVGRWSDLCFAILLPATSGDGAARTLRRIHGILAQPFELEPGGDVIHLEPALSVVVFQPGDTLETLRTRLDDAVEQSRRPPEEPIFLAEVAV